MAYVGCDPDNLKTTARSFDSLVNQVKTMKIAIGDQADALDWVGGDADQFRTLAKVDFAADLVYLGELIEDAAWVLRDNAEMQDTVSGSLETGGLAGIIHNAARIAHNLARIAREEARRQDQFETWWDTQGHLQAELMNDATPEQQAAWWNSLTDDQRRFMLALYPGFLIGMAGLPAAIQATALQNVKDAQKADRVLSSEKTEVGAEVHIPWGGGTFDLAADASATVKRMGDGTYVVELELGGKIGASVGGSVGGAKGSAGVALEGSITQKYEFSSREEAEAFLNGFYKELVPSTGEVAKGFLPFQSTAADAVNDARKYLERFHADTTVFEGKVTGDASLGVGGNGGPKAEISASAGVGARYDTKSGDTTFFAEREFSMSASGGGASGSASLSASVEVVTHGGHATELVINGEFTGTGGSDLAHMIGLPEETMSTIESGARGSMELRIDLTDPVVAQHASELVSRAMNGDAAALSSVRDLYRNAAITVNFDNVAVSENGVDLVVVEGHISHESTSNMASFVKPMGSTQVVKL